MSSSIFYDLFLAGLLSGLVSGAAYAGKWLTFSGAVAATVLGAIILGLGGWGWVAPLLTFFISSTLLSKAPRSSEADAWEAKGSQREGIQVWANGGMAGLLTLSHFLLNVNLYPAYLASLAAANADTWSTEIGIRLGRNPRHLITGRPLPVGTSGGVTIPGFMGGLLGAILITCIGNFCQSANLNAWVLAAITIAGFGGSLFDSFLGATLQARHGCKVCGKSTEKKTHCGQLTDHQGGWRNLNNDGVNLLCTAFGAGFYHLLIMIN